LEPISKSLGFNDICRNRSNSASRSESYEPLSNLDAKLRLEMREEIRRIHDQTKITTLYVTHDQKESLSLADRIAVLNAGIIEQIGAPRELYRSPANQFVADFMGETNWLSATVETSAPTALMLRAECGLIEAQQRPRAKGPPPGGFSRKRPPGFVAPRSQTATGMLPQRASPCSLFRENRTPWNISTGS
jgi:hypothetical protein